MRIKTNPIIGVKDVEASSKWYQTLLECKSVHGGNEFDILASDDGEVLLCLHRWNLDDHPTMMDASITPGNGLILYFRTDNMDRIRENVEKLGGTVEEEIHLNPNSRHKEFSLRDPDDYYLTITEYQAFNG